MRLRKYTDTTKSQVQCLSLPMDGSSPLILKNPTFVVRWSCAYSGERSHERQAVLHKKSFVGVSTTENKKEEPRYHAICPSRGRLVFVCLPTDIAHDPYRQAYRAHCCALTLGYKRSGRCQEYHPSETCDICFLGKQLKMHTLVVNKLLPVIPNPHWPRSRKLPL